MSGIGFAANRRMIVALQPDLTWTPLAMSSRPLRLGIDLGGTKIEAAVLDRSHTVVTSRRMPSPQGDYRATIEALANLVTGLERDLGTPLPTGIGMPGSLSPRTGLVQNANSTWLNGQPLKRDLEARLGRPLRFANDANCFALSEATDGAGAVGEAVAARTAVGEAVAEKSAGKRTVFGVILGTGCGGGLVIDGKLVDGPRGIGGEWGHTPMPWPTPTELDHPPCWCGRSGCLETWVSGPALAADHLRVTGLRTTAEAIAANAATGDAPSQFTFARHANRLARGLAMITNILDPDVIILGGGLSLLPHLYTDLPPLMAPYIFSAHPNPVILPPRWGDSSGVRGAAWLWE